MLNKFKDLIGISELEDEIQEDLYEEEKKEKKQKRENKMKFDEKKEFTIDKKSIDADLYILKPDNYNESASIVDELKRKKTIVLNLESLDKDLKKVIFEFTKGAVYALEANIQKVSNDIFVIAPKGTEIEGKLKINSEKNILRWE